MAEDIENNYKLLLLAGCFLFSDLSFEELDKLAKSTKIKTAKEKDVIFKKNDTGKEMFIIVSGQVSLTAVSDSGKELCFGILGSGNIFGEIALLDNKARTATITAIENTKLLVLEQEPFIAFIKKNPDISMKLLSALAIRLRYADQSIENTVFGQLHTRLARKLLALAKIYGTEEYNGIKITIKLTHKELGKMLGASEEAIASQIKIWHEEGLIAFKQGDILILDYEALKSLIC